MAHPLFADPGKAASDVFGNSKNYHFSTLTLECKTKNSPTVVEFTSGGTSNINSGKVVGNLKTKYKVGEYGK